MKTSKSGCYIPFLDQYTIYFKGRKYSIGKQCCIVNVQMVTFLS